MPNVVGKNYINIHNSLQKLHLKVELETKKFPDKTDGIVLSQSISPGQQVKFDTKVFLEVNQAISNIQMPNLIGHNIENAEKILKKVLDDGIYISLEIGGINYVVSDKEKPNTILEQIPEPNKKINSNEKVYFLVTRPKDLTSLDLKTLEKKPYPFVHKSLKDFNKDFKISKINQVYEPSKNGLVAKVLETEDGKINIEANIKEQLRRIESGYEKFQYNIKKTDTYKVVLNNKETKTQTDLLDYKLFYKGELLSMIFYRKGNVELSLFDSTGLLKQQSYINEL